MPVSVLDVDASTYSKSLTTVILVAGHIRVLVADRDTFLDLSRQAVELAREADGCLDFAVSADLADPERVNIYKRWVDRDALQAFRGDGPGRDLSALIITTDVHEFDVRLRPS
jgi:quinol monooxygenase YgiN